MNIGFHHLFYNYLKPRLLINNSAFKLFINKSVYAVGILGILVTLPQAFTIWVSKNAGGVSGVTWTGFLVGSSFWLFYGIIHKEKPIIFTNLAVILADLTVVLGLILAK